MDKEKLPRWLVSTITPAKTCFVTGRRRWNRKFKMEFSTSNQVINLCNKGLIEVDLSKLYDCKKLEIIHLEGNPLKQVDIGGLRQCPALKSVKVDETVDLVIGGPLGHLTIDITSLFQPDLKTNYNLRGILLENLKHKIKSNIITQKDFLNLQFPLIELLTNWEVLTNLHGYRQPDLIDVLKILGEEYPSFLAPAYHFNQYLHYLSQDVAVFGRILPLRHSVSFDVVTKSALNRSLILIEFENTLISLKTALDRFVRVLSEFFSGIDPWSTFGKITKDGNTKGFMSKVKEGREGKVTRKNEATRYISSYIYDQYFDWIQDLVVPRNELIHYFGALLRYKEIFNISLDQKTYLPTPSVRIRPNIKKKLNMNVDEILLTTDQISVYVTKWYEFFFYLLKCLPAKKRWELEHINDQNQRKNE